MRQGLKMTALWCPREAAPPGSPCPACSSEGLSFAYLHTCHSWPWAHLTRHPGPNPRLGLASRRGLGPCFSSHTLHGQLGSGVAVGAALWVSGRGLGGVHEQPQGLGAICN